MKEITTPKSANASMETLVRKMYISNVAKRLRALNQPSDIDRKRWVWELIQNAKDSIAGDKNRDKVDIRIEIDGDTVRFRHNGNPFTMDARFGLLWKYSEDKENQESTGRFGTGFLTTHCLSKTVGIESNVYDEGNVRGFSVTMFRDGQTEAELLEGLDKMKESEKWFEEPFEWTTFTYHVASESGRRAIQLGRESFQEDIMRTMLFCPELGDVVFNDNGKITSISRKGLETLSDGIKLYTFDMNIGGCHKESRFLVSSYREQSPELTARYKSDRVLRIDAALELDANGAITGEDNALMYYCSLPLIGAENQLDAPVIINSPDFEPDEERQSLLLNDAAWNEEKGTITETGINQMIFKKSVALFSALANHAVSSNAGNLHLLARGLKGVKSHEKTNREWFKSNVIEGYRSILLSLDLVKSLDGSSMKKLGDTIFIKGENEEEEKTLFDVATGIYSDKLSMDNHSWSSILWKDGLKMWDAEDVCKDIESKGNWQCLGLTGEKLSTWYNSFLAYVKNFDENLLKEHALIPDCYGIFHRKDEEEFRQGENISDFVLGLLAGFGNDVRSSLMNRDIKTIDLERKYNSTSYSAAINKIVTDITLKALPDLNKIALLAPVIRIIPSDLERYGQEFISNRISYLSIINLLFGFTLQAQTDNALNKSAWESLDTWLKSSILAAISAKASLSGMPAGLGAAWLSDTISKLDATTDDLNKYKVLPDQYGNFKAHSELYSNNGIPECLKSAILKKVGLDYKSILLHEGISSTACKVTKSKSLADFVNDIRNSFASISYYSGPYYHNVGGKYYKYAEGDLTAVALYMCSILPEKSQFDTDNNWKSTQESIQHVARAILPAESHEESGRIACESDELWKVTNSLAIRAIRRKIEENTTLSGMASASGKNEDQIIDILNMFYRCSTTGRIFPDQKGQLQELSELRKEEGTIDETIKDIIDLIANAGSSFRTRLADRRCSKQPESTLSTTDAFRFIDDTVDEKYKMPVNWEDADFKKAVKTLIEEWAEDNSSCWDESHFGKIYPKKEAILMNVVWDRKERQYVQKIKSSFSEKTMEYLISNAASIETLSSEIEDKDREIERLKTLLKESGNGALIEKSGETIQAKDASGQIATIDLDDTPYAGLSVRQMSDYLITAKERVRHELERQGYTFTQGICPDDYCNIYGVIGPDGKECPLVVHSYLNTSRPFALNAFDWQQLAKENSMLWVSTSEGVRCIPFYALMKNRDTIRISFSTSNLDIKDRSIALAETMRYFKGLNFNFGSLIPDTTSRAERFNQPEKELKEALNAHKDNALSML